MYVQCMIRLLQSFISTPCCTPIFHSSNSFLSKPFTVALVSVEFGSMITLLFPSVAANSPVRHIKKSEINHYHREPSCFAISTGKCHAWSGFMLLSRTSISSLLYPISQRKRQKWALNQRKYVSSSTSILSIIVVRSYY